MKRLNNENLTTSEGKNYNIYELENIKELGQVYSDNNDVYYFKDYTFRIKRVKNDINGNPMYKLELNEKFEDITIKLKGLVTKCYPSKKYALIQSYNLADSLERIFNDLTTR